MAENNVMYDGDAAVKAVTAGETERFLYSTGELAEACGVTVRTVQHYDNKGLLAPTGYSEGGRRLYSEDDAERLRFILMLKSLGLGLTQIKGVLESPNRDKILRTLLDEQSSRLQDELDKRAKQLAAINMVRKDFDIYGKMMATTEPAMVDRMNDERARRRWYTVAIIVGIFCDIAWIGTLVYGILTGVWWPFPLALIFVAFFVTLLVKTYDTHTTYICPVCGADFRPRTREFFFARHTPRTRKLTCPCCHQKDWCVERYHAAPVDIAPNTCIPGTCTQDACTCEGGDIR